MHIILRNILQRKVHTHSILDIFLKNNRMYVFNPATQPNTKPSEIQDMGIHFLSFLCRYVRRKLHKF